VKHRYTLLAIDLILVILWVALVVNLFLAAVYQGDTIDKQ